MMQGRQFILQLQFLQKVSAVRCFFSIDLQFQRLNSVAFGIEGLLAIVYQHIGVSGLFLKSSFVVPFFLASKSLTRKILRIKLLYDGIVELKPTFVPPSTLLDETIVVTTVG